MAKASKLKTETREITGRKVSRVRNEGKVPAVIFGPKHTSTNLNVDLKEFRQVFKAAGYSSLIDAELSDGTVKVLVKEVQTHPVTREPIHVSLYAVDMTSEIETKVPLKLTGISPAVKNNIGILSLSTDSIVVHCLPKDLPHDIEIDISELSEIGHAISAGDLKLPEGVSLSSNQSADERLVAIVPPQKEIVEEEVAAEGEAAEGDAEAAPEAEAEASE